MIRSFFLGNKFTRKEYQLTMKCLNLIHQLKDSMKTFCKLILFTFGSTFYTLICEKINN